jgi:hypothetical protein
MKSAFAGIALLIVIVGSLMLWSRSLEPKRFEPQPLPGDGIQFGFIRAVATSSGYVLQFDDARWLTGTEGENAAIAAGLCTEATRSECIPNSFFIENVSTSTIPLELGMSPLIAMFTLDMDENGVRETEVSQEEFAALINNNEQWSRVPFQMLVEQGKVTIIEEVYVP